MKPQENNKQANPDPEAALSGSISSLDHHTSTTTNKAQTTISAASATSPTTAATTNERSSCDNNNNNELDSSHSSRHGKTNTNNHKKNKKTPESIPMTHPPPPPPPSRSGAGGNQSTGVRNNNNASSSNQQQPPLRLMHPSLHKVPMQVRYAFYGVLSSALFMVLYNMAVERLGYLYVPSTIYAVTYLLFIPIQHAMASCMVFGWPERYFPSLTSNVPVGLSAIAVGSYLTAYLDQMKFNEYMEQGIRDLGLLYWKTPENNNNDTTTTTKDETFSSLLVLIVTSLWSFLLSVFVNTPAETPEKKQQ